MAQAYVQLYFRASATDLFFINEQYL